MMATRPAARRLDPSVDPVHDIIEVVACSDSEADRARLTTQICELVPYPARRLRIAEELKQHPDLLTGGGAYGSASIIRLIELLRASGVHGIVAPACPFCERIVPLPRSRDKMRCCKRCWSEAHAKTCSRCGKVGSMDRRTNNGESLCSACACTETSLHETCSSCGRMALIARRDGELALCKNCCKPPVLTCSVCGQRKPCHFADTNAPRCKNCSDKSRAVSCSNCGHHRVVSRRTEAGEPLCKDCGSADFCVGCQRRRPIRARTEKGNLCQTCYKHDTAAHRTCIRCGSLERLHHFALCATCAWPDTIRKLITAADGLVRAELEPVLAALTAADPAGGLNWAARAHTQKMLSRLAAGTGPITHAVLDELTPATAATHLRVVLVEAGVLPTRDERLLSLERAIDRRVARVGDPTDRKILRSFATWHHLRRLRAIADRQRLTHDQVVYATNSLTTAANLLNWLRERGRCLADCDQEVVDDWLAVDKFSRSRGFVTWAVNRGYAHGIKVPPFINEPTREVFAEHDQRWALARRLLAEDTIILADRVAGLLVLLYAQRAARITRLTTRHIIVDNHAVKLGLGDQPIIVPMAFGQMLKQLLVQRREAVATAPDGGVWLYPGPRLGQPLAPSILLQRLRDLGVPPTVGRNSALMEMAREMPAAVITRLLGISLDRATRWAYDAGNTRPGYAADLGRRSRAVPRSSR